MSDKLQGGAMGGVEELYREVILDHFKSPRNKGKLATPSCSADGVNPLCGDQISISATIEGEKIKDIRFQGQGCAISQSAASMMTEAIKGKSISDARRVASRIKTMFGVKDASLPAADNIEMGDMEALEGVKKYPVRIKCALLSWNTMLETLSKCTTEGHK